MNSSSLHPILFQIVKRVRAELEQWLIETKAGITLLQFGILKSVAKEKMGFNELARHLSLQPPSILPSVDALERQGRIVRRGDPDDRRKVYLVITAKGKKLLGRVSGTRHIDSVTKAFRKMSQAKQKRLIALLEEFTKKIDN